MTFGNNCYDAAQVFVDMELQAFSKRVVAITETGCSTDLPCVGIIPYFLSYQFGTTVITPRFTACPFLVKPHLTELANQRLRKCSVKAFQLSTSIQPS